MRALAAALLAALFAHGVLRVFLSSSFAALLLDRASTRSLHSGAVPRVGGLGIALATLAWLAVAGLDPWPPGTGALALAAFAMLALSLLDDIRPLPAAPRLVAHLAAATAVALAWNTPLAWLPLASLVIAWGTNLYNFMDGSDGLAGGMTVFGYSVLAVAAHGAGEPAVASLCAVIAGATLGFLPLNWHPARVFLGDAGSIPLGFTAAALSVLGVLRGWWPAALPLIAFFPFVFDASVTLVRRALRGARVTVPHREHLYQRATLAGLGHRRVALAAYALMAACAVAALVARESAPLVQLAILLSVAVLHGAVMYLLQRWLDPRSKP